MFRTLIVFFLHLGYVFAMETLVIGENDSYGILSYSEYTAVNDMNELPNSLVDKVWHKNKFNLDLNKKHQGYWIRVKVKNSQNVLKELYLIDERRYVYSIEYYLLKDGKVTTYKKDGFYVKENVSSFNASQRIFTLSLEASEEAEVLFKVQSYNMSDIPFKIVTKDYLVEYFQVYSFLQGAFFSVLFVMVVYNFITYLIGRARVYLYYLAYALLLLIYQGSYFGYLKNLNIEPAFLLSLMILSGVGFIIFAVFFIKELFQLKKYLPKIDKAFAFLAGYLIIIMLLQITFTIKEDFYLSQFMFNMVSLAMPLYVFMLVYALNYLWYKKVNKMAFFYAIIWNFISLFGLLLVATHSSFISTDVGIDYLFQLGMFIESILFSLILSSRIKEIEQEKQEQELMLVQQSRLASMGEIISTIAHQWRQPLSQINGRVLGLDMDYKKKRLTDELMEAHLSDIEKTTANMSAIINDFINFFNSNKKIEEFSIQEVFVEAIRIVKSSSAKKVEIDCNVEDLLLTGYKSELIQAILIVINNGIDAYAGTKIAKIYIEVKEEDEKQVKISIKDNGTGISDEVLSHLFEPYYTTKHKSQGTGLGLYILKMIVENGMGGKAYIKNDIGGATFTIIIPKSL